MSSAWVLRLALRLRSKGEDAPASSPVFPLELLASHQIPIPLQQPFFTLLPSPINTPSLHLIFPPPNRHRPRNQRNPDSPQKPTNSSPHPHSPVPTLPDKRSSCIPSAMRMLKSCWRGVGSERVGGISRSGWWTLVACLLVYGGWRRGRKRWCC